MEKNNISIIIPTLEPPSSLPDYIRRLKEAGFEDIIVLDDGSPDGYQSVFKALEQEEHVKLLRHGVNLGKGRALKSAFNYVMVSRPQTQVVVTADHDETYLPEDVMRVAMAAEENTMTLGCRDFHSANMPVGNRRTNFITHYLLKLLSGIVLSDTQTGLRAYPRSMLGYLIRTMGERYDYEFNMIFDKKEIRLKEVPITTVPRASGKKSHFRPFRDTWSIISAFLIFILVSLSSTILDLAIYQYLISALIDVLPLTYITVATFMARVVSDTYNYWLDKKLVFKADETAHFKRYVLLAVLKTAASALLVSAGVFLLGDGELWFKLVVDMMIFFVGYRVEKTWVYAN